jgi:hypothetical protein
MKRSAIAVFCFALVFGGSALAGAIQPPDPQGAFWERLSALCGNAYEGELTVYHARMDEGWLGQRIVMHVRECSEDEIKIPLHVGEDRSRTWIVTRTEEGLRLKHDHRHEDGSEDPTTWYGGHTTDPGRAWRQSFPVDAFSRGLFLAQGLDVSITNIWAMEVHPDEKFAYELLRVGRHLRVEFDTTRPVEAPPAPWGHE